jgi:hypothetical protein
MIFRARTAHVSWTDFCVGFDTDLLNFMREKDCPGSEFYDLPVEFKQRCLRESKKRYHLSQTMSQPQTYTLSTSTA